MKRSDQGATDDSPRVETDEVPEMHGVQWMDDAKFSVFLLLHQYEIGCWRAATPH